MLQRRYVVLNSSKIDSKLELKKYNILATNNPALFHGLCLLVNTSKRNQK